ncbi:MAG: DUF4097 family beta strand repeat-containing protein [bacterium]|nr:DUF4097 family beta strand repeat-containing protein [bacterium]
MNVRYIGYLVILGWIVSKSIGAEVEELYQKEISAEGTQKFILTNTNGNLLISASNQEKITVKANKKASGPTKSGCDEILSELTITVTKENQNCIVNTNFPKKWKTMYSVSVDYDISVPKRLFVELETTNGSIEVNGVEGEIRGNTTNGKIKGIGVKSKLFAETTNGDIEVEGTVDHLKLETTNGDIQIHSHLLKNALLFVETVNGSIQLSIPSKTNGRVKAETVNGTVTISPWDATYNKRKNQASAVLGSGEGTIQLETTNGNIRVIGYK